MSPASTLRAPAETAIHQCMGLQSAESCVIVTDDERLPIGEVLYDVAVETTDDVALLRYPPGDQHGEEPPSPVAAAMAGADVVLAPTTKSVTHTRARTDAIEAGARVATLPGITEEVFTTGMDADYESIRDECERLLARVEGASTIRVTAPAGTDITFEPGARKWNQDTGIAHDPGQLTNLPAGEIFVSPETATGRYVVDGTIRPHGKLDPGQTVAVDVEDGYVTDISDEAVRADIEEAAEAVGRAAYNLAELGIGTNRGVEALVGSVLLDEKAAGTVHIAIGDDHGIGGEVEAPIHLDGIITGPTVYADGERISLPGED